MPTDNLTLQSAAPATPGAGNVIASRNVTYSGESTHIGVAGLVKFTGSDDAKVATDVDPATETKQDLIVTLLTALQDLLAGGTGGNLAELDGNTVDLGTGNIGTGTIRIVIAANQPIVSTSIDASTIPGATPVMITGLTNSAQTVIAAAQVLDGLQIFNPSNATAYVQIYDTAGAVVVGTTTPVWSIGIAAGASVSMADVNLAFANAIKVAATTTATGSSAPSSSLQANFSYR